MGEQASKKNAKLRKGRLAALVLVVLLFLGMLLGMFNARPIGAWARDRLLDIIHPGNPGPPPAPGENLNILCIGIDKGSVEGETGYCRSDVLIVVSIDQEDKKAALISIPRDTRVEIEGHGIQKINAAYAFGGPSAAMAAVSGLTGMQIHRYLEVDFEAFRCAVDAVDGVPIHMDYEIRDERVGCLPSGDLLLYGKEALVLCRSRDLPDGDLGRIRNQQKFLTAMAGKLAGEDLRTLKGVYDVVNRYLDTDMAGSELWGFAEALQGVGMENIQMATLPGSEPKPAPGELWYYVHDPAATSRLVENVEKYCTVAALAEDMAEQVALAGPAELSLAVLNATDRSGLAAAVADTIKQAGYLPSVGNTGNPYELTTIYVAPGYSEEAAKVAGLFWNGECPAIKVDEEVTGFHQADVVVVLGGDCP